MSVSTGLSGGYTVIHGRNPPHTAVDARSERCDAVMQKPTEVIVNIFVDCTILVTLCNYFALTVILEFDAVDNPIGTGLQYAYGSAVSILTRNKDS